MKTEKEQNAKEMFLELLGDQKEKTVLIASNTASYCLQISKEHIEYRFLEKNAPRYKIYKAYINNDDIEINNLKTNKNFSELFLPIFKKISAELKNKKATILVKE